MKNFRLEDIEKARNEFGFDIQKLSENDSLNFHSKVYSKYSPSGSEVYPLWEKVSPHFSVREPEAWQWLDEFIDMQDTFLFFDKEDEIFVFSFHCKKQISSFLEIFPWDFYFTNKDLEYLVTHNDSDYLITAGKAIDWLKTKVKVLGNEGWMNYDMRLKREFINNLHKEKAKNDPNSRSLARALKTLSNNIYGEPSRFIFELLQNANDSVIEGKNIDVKFIVLSNNYIIFQHNGCHFDEEDIKSISDINDSTKKLKSEKIGYKGIGFKSVFGSSNCVYIKSGGYNFKFDKGNFSEKDEYPWQIIPIFFENDELVDIKDYLKDNLTCIIIKIENVNDFFSKISEVLSDSRIILFTKYIQSIQFFQNDKLVKSIQKKHSNEHILLQEEKQPESYWLLRKYKINFDDKIKQKLINSKDEFPDKLKKSEKTEISFALAYDSEKMQIQKLYDSIIYCYLPTTVNLQFPFLVNADFLTDASREHLSTNSWNNYLLEKIGFFIIKLISEFAEKDNYKYSVLNILPKRFSKIFGSLPEIEESFNKGLEKALKEVAFLPELNSSKLLKVEETRYDETKRLIEIIAKHRKIGNYLDNKVEIESLNQLESIGVKKASLKQLMELALEDYPDHLCIDIIKFFSSEDKAIYNSELKEIAFLPDNNLNLKTPSEIYFPDENFISDDLIIKLSFIKSDVYNQLQEEEIKWLISNGVRHPKKIEIFRKSIISLIKENKISKEDNYKITRFIFSIFTEPNELTHNDFQELKNYKLLTQKNNYKLPSNCYLSDKYIPEISIEKYIKNDECDIFISDKYVENDEAIWRWRDFFLKFGVKDNVEIKFFNIIPREQLIENYKDDYNFSNYIRVETNSRYRDHGYTRDYEFLKYEKEHKFHNILYLQLYLGGEYLLSNYEFAKYFFNYFFDNKWKAEFLNESKYQTKHGTNRIKTYFEYITKSKLTIPCVDGNLRITNHVYTNSPKIKEIIQDEFPIIDVDRELTNEQAEFLGIKTELTAKDCLNVLISIANKNDLNENQIERISKIYGYLKENNIPCDFNWKTNGKLIASDNKFYSPKELFFSDSFDIPENSDKFINIPLDLVLDDKLKNLFLSLGVNQLTKEDIESNVKEAKKEDNTLSEIFQKIEFISIISSHKIGNNFTDEKNRLEGLIKSIKFFQCKEIFLNILFNNTSIIEYKKSVFFDSKSKSLFYTKPWKNETIISDFVKNLCEFLDIHQYKLEEDIRVILRTENNDLIEWMIDKNYPVPEDMKLIIEHKEEKQLLESGNSTLNQFTVYDEEKLKDIGRKGEKLAFEKLKKEYEKENVIWLNEKDEKGKPYDILIQENKKYIEVKSCQSYEFGYVHITKKEIEFFLEHQEEFSICFIWDIENEEKAKHKLIVDSNQIFMILSRILITLLQKKGEGVPIKDIVEQI